MKIIQLDSKELASYELFHVVTFNFGLQNHFSLTVDFSFVDDSQYHLYDTPGSSEIKKILYAKVSAVVK